MRAEGKCVNGSPLSAIVTNFYMEFFKHLALEIAHLGPGSGRGVLMTSLYPQEGHSRTSSTTWRDSAYHQVHCGVEEDGTLPFLSWTLWPGGGRVEVWTSLSTEPHTHRQVPPLPIPPPSPCEERSGQVPPWQGQRDHELTGQTSEGSGPPGYGESSGRMVILPTWSTAPLPHPTPMQVLDPSIAPRETRRRADHSWRWSPMLQGWAMTSG